MATNPKRLSGPSPLTNAAVTQYTTPAATKTIIRCIHVNNPTGGNIGLTMSIGADAAGDRIYDAYPIVPGAQDLFCYHVLEATEIIQAFASTTGVLVVEMDGEERTP